MDDVRDKIAIVSVDGRTVDKPAAHNNAINTSLFDQFSRCWLAGSNRRESQRQEKKNGDPRSSSGSLISSDIYNSIYNSRTDGKRSIFSNAIPSGELLVIASMEHTSKYGIGSYVILITRCDLPASRALSCIVDKQRADETQSDPWAIRSHS